MYLNFFGLKKEPFQITPDPAFLFLSPAHKEALASIIYGVEKKKGFILIVGAVGVGKTTILRAYLEKSDNDQLTKIYVFNANISYTSLLKLIFRELGLTPLSTEISDMVNQLHQALINEYKQNRNVLLLIDEAQNMPIDTLENLRMLSNLETPTEKLIQIVFSAQPEFEKTLNLDELKQLKQRIAVKAVIRPLTREEGLAYIDHRLRTAADRDPIIFTRYAKNEVVRVSQGIPRVINVICDNSLITAFGYGKKKVGYPVIREITRDFGIQKPLFKGWRIAVGALLLLALAGYWKVTGKGAPFAPAPAKPLYATRIPDSASLPEESPARKVSDEGGGRKDTAAASRPTEGDRPQAGTVSRVVKRGDTLAEMIREVYGYVDNRMISMVKKANPHIDDENLIIEGRRIFFPGAKR
jgi:general secretion pathway protein A